MKLNVLNLMLIINLRILNSSDHDLGDHNHAEN